MKKKRLISLIIIFIFLIISIFAFLQYFYKNTAANYSHLKNKNSYFVPVPIVHWTPELFPAPCISIQIENQTITTLLDLGFKGFFSFSVQLLNKIENKKHVGALKRYDFRGIEYNKEVFEIPSIQMGRIRFSQIPVQKESEDFHKNSLMSQSIATPPEDGLMGWEICQLAGNLLLDLQNGTIAFCDSLETLKVQGYAVESFTKTPLLSNRGLIELMATVDSATLRCVLDTGSTCNCLHTALQEGQSIDDIINNPANILEMKQFQIENKELGPLVFRGIPIELPIHVDALLGMDFFLNHLVFISFTDQAIYFAKTTKKVSV